MKNTLSILFALFFCQTLFAQVSEEAPKKPSAEELQAHQMKIMMPGEKHKLLQKLVGDFDETVYAVMEPGKEAQAMKVNGKGVGQMILGGRFVQMNGTGEAMGMKSERLSIFGHDNRRDKYTLNAFDTFGTYGIYAEGDYDEVKKELVLIGTEKDPEVNYESDFKMVFRFLEDGSYEFEVWFMKDMNGADREWKAVWGTAKKKK